MSGGLPRPAPPRAARAALARWIAGRRDLRRLLVAVARHGPPGGACIAAGCLRNALWDAMLRGARRWPSAADVDVVFHAPSRATAEADAAWTRRLAARCPGPCWAVANQARMHRRNGHAPYRGLAAALAHWPETATAVAARLRGGRVEVLAPLGLGDLLRGVLRPGPAHRRATVAVRARMQARGWRRRWPRLRRRGV